MTTPLDLPLSDLTSGELDGTGVFDVLMRATKIHLDEEFSKNRIRGPEYAQIYLGSVQSVLATSLAFVVQGAKLNLEQQLLAKQVVIATKQAELITQQALNAVLEGTVLQATQCKLTAEYDNLMLSKERVVAETVLLGQKTSTERAQTSSLGVDADSVVGRQKQLYDTQAQGITRDAEQKAARLMVDSWNVRKTTDTDGTSANVDNKLTDASIGRAVDKLLAGVQA